MQSPPHLHSPVTRTCHGAAAVTRPNTHANFQDRGACSGSGSSRLGCRDVRYAQAALDDPRFSGLVGDAAFALDPFDPRFRHMFRTEAPVLARVAPGSGC